MLTVCVNSDRSPHRRQVNLVRPRRLTCNGFPYEFLTILRSQLRWVELLLCYWNRFRFFRHSQRDGRCINRLSWFRQHSATPRSLGHCDGWRTCGGTGGEYSGGRRCEGGCRRSGQPRGAKVVLVHRPSGGCACLNVAIVSWRIDTIIGYDLCQVHLSHSRRSRSRPCIQPTVVRCIAVGGTSLSEGRCGYMLVARHRHRYRRRGVVRQWVVILF